MVVTNERSAGGATEQRMAEEARIELLIGLFKMDGKPHHMSYQWRRDYYKRDKPILQIMLRRNLIEVLNRDTTTILFNYKGN